MDSETPKKSSPICPNCREHKPDEFRFCSNCGQKHTKLNESLWFVISDMFVQLLSVDGRAFRTFFNLIIRPGFLSCEYRVGRRQRYIGPIQIFLLSSFLYFLVIGLTQTINNLDPSNEDSIAQTLKENKELLDELDPVENQEQTETDIKENPVSQDQSQVATKENKSGQEEKSRKKDKAVEKDKDDELLDREYNISLGVEQLRMSLRELRSVKNMSPQEVDQFIRSKGGTPNFWTVRLLCAGSVLFDSGGMQKLFDQMVQMGAQFSIIFVPLLAVLLRTVYLLKENRLLHTMVFSSHLHASVLILGALLALTGIGTAELIGIQSLFFVAFLFFGLKKFYQQGWIFTIFKTGLICLVYFMVACFAAVVFLLAAIFTL